MKRRAFLKGLAGVAGLAVLKPTALLPVPADRMVVRITARATWIPVTVAHLQDNVRIEAILHAHLRAAMEQDAIDLVMNGTGAPS